MVRADSRIDVSDVSANVNIITGGPCDGSLSNFGTHGPTVHITASASSEAVTVMIPAMAPFPQLTVGFPARVFTGFGGFFLNGPALFPLLAEEFVFMFILFAKGLEGPSQTASLG